MGRLHWSAFSSQRDCVWQLTRFASWKWKSGLNRISHPDWVKLSVELNLRAKQNTKFPSSLQCRSRRRGVQLDDRRGLKLVLTAWSRRVERAWWLRPSRVLVLRTKWTDGETVAKVCQVKLVTVVEGDQKVPFSIATTPKCRGGRYSFPRIAPLDPWYVPYIAEC